MTNAQNIRLYYHATSARGKFLPLTQQSIESLIYHSAYLCHLYKNFPEWLEPLINQSQDFYQALAQNYQEINALTALKSEKDFMQQSRLLKNKAALLIAVADLAGYFSFAEICNAISETAEALTRASYHFALKEFAPSDPNRATPSDDNIKAEDSGFVIIALGKLGAGELNYSSDIDLLLLYEPEIFAPLIGATNPEKRDSQIKRFAQYLLKLLDERTADGYLYRTDLRLRPNPSSTPPAMSINSAIVYYESIARNWERMVMLRARPIAGDLKIGESFLQHISPFVWRKNLDYTALEDIYQVQKQIGKKNIENENLWQKNVKTGVGGIRDCEFAIQLLQLLWGGKYLELRTHKTLDALEILRGLNLVSEEMYQDLYHAYPFLRTLEHRLQMLNDQQIQTLPNNEDDFENFVNFIGYDSTDNFRIALKAITEKCHNHTITLYDFLSLPDDYASNLVVHYSHEDWVLLIDSLGFHPQKGDFEHY